MQKLWVARARALLCSACLIGWLCSAAQPRAYAQAVSGADEKRARAAFEEGRSAFAEGRYDEALERFQLSYALSKRPVLLFNIGSVLDRLRHDEEAIDAYYRYLEAIPNAENRKAVLARMNVLRRSVEEKRAADAQLEAARAAAQVPTPEQVARQELASDPSVNTAQERKRDDQRPLVKKWWFWTSIASVVVVGAVVGAVVASSGSEKTEGPLLGPGTRKVEL